jgi:hypothetical protein
VNHEQETATYGVKLKIDGEFVPFKVEIEGGWQDVGEEGFSLILNNGEKWEQKIGFAPEDVCVSTTLAEAAHENDTSIKVISADGLAEGDILQLGDIGTETREFVQVKAIEGNTIILEKELKQDHEAGTRVVKPQKVEFLLFKGDGGEPYLDLYLWVDVKQE